jgi:ElaB/YqjD/DUF883 family membrane-anchored ribosome-binding protein
MFHHRSSAFGPSVTAIQKHLGAVEKELEKMGRIAGGRGSAAAAAASDQIGDSISSISSILGDMLDRFRLGRQVAGEQASRALDLGGKYGGDALQRVTNELEDRPLITLGVAVGIGVLIGAAVLGGVSMNRSQPKRARR